MPSTKVQGSNLGFAALQRSVALLTSLVICVQASAQVDPLVTPSDAAAAPSPPSQAPRPASFELLPRTAPANGGLTAAAVSKRAIEVSPRARRADEERGHAERRAERASFLFAPRLDMSATYMRLSDVPEPPGFPGQPSFFPNLPDTWTLRAGVRIPVSEYLLSLRDRYKSAQHLASFGQLQREAEHQAVAYDALREYYELARALADYTLATHRTQQLQLFVDEIAALVAGGELGAVDLAQARARLSGAQSGEHRARATHKLAEDTLRRRLALGAADSVGVAEDLIEITKAAPEQLDSLQREAERNRPEVRALQALILAHERTRDAVASARYPTLSVLGDLTVANPNQRYIPPEAEFNATWSVGVQLAWSPTDLSVQNQNLDDTELEVVRAREDLRALHDRIALEVASAFENAVAARGAATTSRAALEAAQQTHEILTALFRGGEGTSRMVLDAELDLRIAQRQWVDDVLSTHLSEAALRRAVGRPQP